MAFVMTRGSSACCRKRHWIFRLGRRDVKRTANLWIVAIALVACEDATGLDPDALPDVRAYVVETALAALNPRGHFELPVPQHDGPPIIPPHRAVLIADAHLRRLIQRSPNNVFCLSGFACQSTKTLIQDAQCEEVEWSKVSIRADRWFYGEPPHLPVPDTLPIYVLNHVGPRYHIPVMERDKWIATISVAAHATNVTVSSSGNLTYTSQMNGNELDVFPVGCDSPAGIPPAPEQAVVYAARETGRKISRVPQLIHPVTSVASGGGRWKIELDEPINVRAVADGSVHRTKVVYVSAWPDISEPTSTSFGLRLMIPTPVQPAENIPVIWPDLNGQRQTLLLPRHPDRPLHLMQVGVDR